MSAAPSQVECGPAAERACADDNDSWCECEGETRASRYIDSDAALCRIYECSAHRVGLSSPFWHSWACAVSVACSTPAPPPAKPSSDAAFTEVARDYLEDTLSPPADAGDLPRYPQVRRRDQGSVPAGGRSTRSRPRGSSGSASRRSTPRRCRPPTSSIASSCSCAIDSRILTLEIVRPWARDPDSYSSGLTNTAYLMIKRAFAPPEERLRSLIAREKAMPAALAEARKNLENPPRIYTEIAIEQIDGNRDFFKTAVASAFPTVTDKALLAEFKQANDAVIAALDDYKKWLKDDLLKRSNGDFAIGEDTFRKKLAADEMIDAAARRAARDRREGPAEEPGRVRRDGAPHRSQAHADAGAREGPGRPSARGEAAGDDAGRARRARPLHDRPPHRHDPEGGAGAWSRKRRRSCARRRRASMDIPGPFETVATEAYYNMTLPDPKLSADGQHEFMSAVVLRGDLERLGARGLAGPLPAVSLRQARSRPTSARSSARHRTAKAGRTTASRWSSTRASTPTTRAIAWRRSRTPSSATPASSSASACTPGA